MKKDVIIALPLYDGRIDAVTMQMIQQAALDKDSPVKGYITVQGDSLVSRARNNLAYQFLKHDKTDAMYMMFIDSDIHFKPEQIAQLRSHNMPVVAGLYFLKNLQPRPVLNAPVSKQGNLVQVKEVGTGFLMIRRDVFGAMKEAFDLQYAACNNEPNQEEPRFEFFPVGRIDRSPSSVLLSEDYYFCRLLEKIGIPIYVDDRCIVGHRGNIVYPVKPAELVKAAIAALNTMYDPHPIGEAERHELQAAIDTFNARAGGTSELPQELDWNQ